VSDSDRLARAIAAIDNANGDDPISITARGHTGPKEVVHAQLVTEWVKQLRPDADDALLLAARGHHLRRWTVPRNTYADGRAGYLKWRKDLHAQHAQELGALLAKAGYDDDTIARVQSLVRKEGLGRDPLADVQVLEDALCLVFLETQFSDVAARLAPDTLARVVVKTTNKMSDRGRAQIASLRLGDASLRLLDEALACDAVRRYLDALSAHDWSALASTLAPDVHRIGPYGDIYDGRDRYCEFLETTIQSLSGYTLEVHRLIAHGATVAVELAETVDDKGARLHTDETVVFDAPGGLITHVAVYLQQSIRGT
jgi:limonene-1,2-epoxide hydrolase